MSNKKPWYEQSAPKFVAYRGAEGQAAVAAALQALPADHAARRAFAEGVDTIALTHLVPGYPEVRDALCAAYIEACGRLLQGRVSFNPFPKQT